MRGTRPPEPWLRGTLGDLPAVPRAVLHALELAEEDLTRWCAHLTEEQLSSRPGGVPSVGFQIRHIARSVDRLVTYAEGRQLDAAQMAALEAEIENAAKPDEVFAELRAAFDQAARRIGALAAEDLESARSVGRKELPTTLGGLLVHVADHTQRHVGQAITTAKIVRAESGPEIPQE
jgi:uncharacterized damage-inducible protein DinB